MFDKNQQNRITEKAGEAGWTRKMDPRVVIKGDTGSKNNVDTQIGEILNNAEVF